MRYYFILALFLSISCSTVKNTAKIDGTTGKLNINFHSENNVVNLNGLINITNDSSFFNLFGPLGINVAKIQVIADSINIVDIQNKMIYRSYYPNLSKNIFNIFSGRFSTREEQLICALCFFIDSDTWKNLNCSNNPDIAPEFNYNFKGSKKREITIAIHGKKINYMIKMKYVPDVSKKVKSFAISKYLNFETISIKLQ